MEQAREIRLTDELRQLIICAVVRCRKGRECSRVETGRVTDGGDKLPGAIHEQRAERLRLTEEAFQGFSYSSEVVLSERPVGRAGGHLAPVTALLRGVSACAHRAA